MGRAIVRRPAVFLFDEPLSNLDAKLRTRMRTELARLHGRLKTTTVYVTHDQVEAMTLADRIVVMNGGVVQQVGSPLQLYQRPANRFVAGFIGTPAMNFIDGQLCADGDGLSFVGQGLTLALSQDQSSRLAQSKAKAMVTLGVRPTDLQLSVRSDDRPAADLVATVEVREPLGAEIYLHLRCAAGAITARVDSECLVREGDEVQLGIPLPRLHLFDRATEETLLGEAR